METLLLLASVGIGFYYAKGDLYKRIIFSLFLGCMVYALFMSGWALILGFVNGLTSGPWFVPIVVLGVALVVGYWLGFRRSQRGDPMQPF